MKTEKSIMIITSFPLLASAIFMSYHTPPVDRSAGTEYLIGIETYMRVAKDRIALDNTRKKELHARLATQQNEHGQNGDNESAIFQKKIYIMNTTLDYHDGIGPEARELFKKEFENDLTEQHGSLINLIIEKSNSLNCDGSIRSFIK